MEPRKESGESGKNPLRDNNNDSCQLVYVHQVPGAEGFVSSGFPPAPNSPGEVLSIQHADHRSKGLFFHFIKYNEVSAPLEICKVSWEYRGGQKAFKQRG